MIGGYINCIDGVWKPDNINEKYNIIEANGLNKLNICFDGKGTDKYDLKPTGKKLWYLKNNNKIKYILIDIIDEIKKQNLYNLNSNTVNKIKDPYNILSDACNMREKKSYIYEKKDGMVTNTTKKHQEYYNKLHNFLLLLEAESDYIDQRIKIFNQINKNKGKPRNRSSKSRSSKSTTSKNNSTRSRSRSSSIRRYNNRRRRSNIRI
jgi:hypothetical protein